MAKYNPYEINSGYIFSDVLQNWKKYDRKFLATTFQEAIQMVLYNKKIFTAVYKDGQEDYFKNYEDFRYERDLKDAENEEYFPFPDYFLIKKEPNDKYPSIVCYQEPVIITKESNYFDLFFALKLSVTDIMKADEFLEYQLEHTFINNITEYKSFLENLIIKYSEFLTSKFDTIIIRFINNKTQIMEDNNNLDDVKKGNYTLARQVLAIHYMLDELGINHGGTDKTDIARFIQFLTGKEINAKTIKNTNIYKRVNSVLSHSEKSAESDLQFIREYFEKLGLIKIANKISKEIASKE